MIRNVIPFRLPEGWPWSAAETSKLLTRQSFQPCGGLDPCSSGFVPAHEGGDLCHAIQGLYVIAFQTEERILPSSVVNDAAQERAEEIESQQGYRPGRKQMKEIKDAVLQELLPRAFTRRRRLLVLIDTANKWLLIEASSRARADDVISALGKAFDTLPIRMIDTRISPVAAMTHWLAEGEAPGVLTIDQDCDLVSLDQDGGAVRYLHHNLDDDDVRRHIVAGKHVVRMALTYSDRISFMLNEKFEIKRAQLLDVVKTEAGESEVTSQMEQFDADVLLFAAELAPAMSALVDGMGGMEQRDPDLVDGAREAA